MHHAMHKAWLKVKLQKFHVDKSMVLSVIVDKKL